MHPARRTVLQDCALLASLVALASLHAFPGQAARLHAVFMMLVTVGGTALFLVRAVRSNGHARRVWWTGGIGYGLWAYAEVVVGVDSLSTGVGGIRDLTTNIVNLLALLFTVAAMLMIPTAPRSAAGRARMLLDGTIAAAALFGMVWVLIIEPMIAVEGTRSALFDAAYPVLTVAVVAIGVVVLAGSSRRNAGALKLIVGGVLLVSVTLLVELSARTGDQAWLRPWILDGYIVSAGLIAVAPMFSLPRRQDREWRPGSTFFGVLPYLPMAGYTAVCLVPVFTGRVLDTYVVVAGIVLVCAVLARQFLTISRNIALSRDLAQQRARYAHEATHDALTGLPNRARLGDALAKATGDAVLLMIDLDGFKAVNDTLGHSAGDQLLVTIAGRLRHAMPARGAVCARLGGDEFAVLLTEGGLPVARDLARTLLSRCANPVALDGRIATVRASIGIATGTTGLLREADLALYEAKNSGKNQYRVFDQELSAAVEAQRRLETELGEALEKGQFTLLYQPVVDLATGVPVAGEQVLQWQHPRLGTLAAAEFLPAAADAGLLPEIDRWVVETAVRDLARWRVTNPDFEISLELSGRYLASGTVVTDLHRALSAHRQPGAKVSVRVQAGDGLLELRPVLAELRGLGARVVLERFGIGHAAVVHLRDLQVDALKLSPLFLSELDTVPESAALLAAIVARAEGLGLLCVAGGVARPADAEALRRLGCRVAQGPLFGAPVPAGQLSLGIQIQYAQQPSPTATTAPSRG